MKISGPKCSGFVSPAKDTLVVAQNHQNQFRNKKVTSISNLSKKGFYLRPISYKFILKNHPNFSLFWANLKKTFGKYRFVTGNELWTVILWSYLDRLFRTSHLPQTEKNNLFVVKSFVTSDSIKAICRKFNIKCFLTIICPIIIKK